MHRKSVIRRLSKPLERRPRRCERGPEYGQEFDAALLVIWEATDCVCPERLNPSLAATAGLLQAHHELALTPTLREHLAEVSGSTVRRHSPCNRYRSVTIETCRRHVLTSGDLCSTVTMHCGLRSAARVSPLPQV